MKGRTAYILMALVVVATGVIFMLTIFNKRWWLKRSAVKWKLQPSEIDGVKWLDRQYSPLASWRVDYILEQPLRGVKEFYDTGDLKEPGGVGDAVETTATV